MLMLMRMLVIVFVFCCVYACMRANVMCMDIRVCCIDVMDEVETLRTHHAKVIMLYLCVKYA